MNHLYLCLLTLLTWTTHKAFLLPPLRHDLLGSTKASHGKKRLERNPSDPNGLVASMTKHVRGAGMQPIQGNVGRRVKAQKDPKVLATEMLAWRLRVTLQPPLPSRGTSQTRIQVNELGPAVRSLSSQNTNVSGSESMRLSTKEK